MQLIETVRMATTTLTANKLRSSLTMLGIIIGNASVIAMVGIGQGAQELAKNEFQSLGPNTLFITPGSREERQTTFDAPKTLVYEDAKAIEEQVPSIQGVAPQITSNQVISYQGKNSNDSVFGVTPEFLSVRSFEIAEGRFIRDLDLRKNSRVAVLGSEIANRFFGGENPIGKQIRVKNSSFKVVGVMASKGAFLGNNQDDTVYIPLTTMANQIVGRQSIYGINLTFISVSAKDEDSIRAAKFQIENLLRLRHNITGEDDFSVQTQQDVLSIVGTVTGGLTAMLAAIASISLLVGGIGVMNIMLVSVSERTQEIGLRKALGAREKDILTQFLIEATILAVLGGFFGTIIGGGVVILAGTVSPLSSQISVPAVVVSVSVSAGIGLAFGVIPARQAAKLDPIVALRSA
ncbi:ABC transporter permease [Dactylococcopsis salina]|uniref:ABC-type antimicrobial peptide transport system, permease component n=1 Tax=Dactylococcopsis salina (strain PCC 8305) TaxID=13035 RepID=K9YT94_DACS8|nr:ABC transporter permease [Dactylococcopsis salina]AFZ50161.1 ABC-type antimicrobial peptide transport system, permease component [Dactylococcopsis salina PCC 8305]